MPRLIHLLLALALLAGQTLAVVHAAGHELDRGQQHQVCELCALAHAGGQAPDAPRLYLPPETAVQVQQALPAAPAAQPLNKPPCRGPPTLLA